MWSPIDSVHSELLTLMLYGREMRTQLERLSVVVVQDIRRLSNNYERIKVIYVHIVNRIYCLELMGH
ncbi:hypothetical protein BMF90_05155 [Serratia sp. OLHL2]|nr:hypothetical protein BMF87_04430 [Serratia sp. OLEL1]PII59862.1 hypothetical protein BMF85_08540 [Serratia sp. OLCL1]PII64752.1 hypothetical protein BMF92_07445 [Serratia sp. OLBL1]PII66211.1 hypothetical protein BMF90_05155 [Serratia sp. OLHL2]PII77043.1 hypothetical protein BMH23_05725 [Serratia sp. OLIL2]PII78950.1 hypothetical protein BMF88_03840 [Serratia sp. OLDL1]PII80955.1 hypothetical protein BMH24_08140 [Serratia sp. OLJL1]PII93448.1 hypothetical protein BMF91_09615 [Serratia sp